MRCQFITALSVKRNVGCPEDGDKFLSEMLIYAVLNGFGFHKAVRFVMQCQMIETFLWCKKVIEDCMFRCVH